MRSLFIPCVTAYKSNLYVLCMLLLLIEITFCTTPQGPGISVTISVLQHLDVNTI